MQVKFLSAAAVACCAFSMCAHADFRADFQASGGDAGLSRIELSGSQLRVDGNNSTMLLDASNGRMLLLMHDKHQYIDVQKITATAGAAMAQASAALANLPPEQRAMIEQRMGGHMPGAKVDMSMTPTGAADRVAGFACQVYRTQVNGHHTGDACLADVGDAGISASDRATLREAFAKMQQMTERMSAGMFKSPVAALPGDRFPVRMTGFDDAGNVKSSADLKGISTAGISPADFAVPAGYTEQDVGDMMHRH